MIDAIEQFEPTQHSSYGLWLPRNLPANLCLIVTGLPCDTIDILAARPGAESIDIPPLTETEARDIALFICRRYGRDLTPEILSVLLTHRTQKGDPAHGNPLCLTLATEQLNLIRSDDFIRADRLKEADPEYRLTLLLSQVAADFPSSIPGMFETMLAYLEDVYGRNRVSAFGSVLLLGRQGWREQDLLAILPEVEHGQWSDLDVALLRRSFRGQLARRARGGFLMLTISRWGLQCSTAMQQNARTARASMHRSSNIFSRF